MLEVANALLVYLQLIKRVWRLKNDVLLLLNEI